MQAVSDLQAKIRGLGGGPEKRGSVSGSLHRAWVDLKSRITGMDEAAGYGAIEAPADDRSGAVGTRAVDSK